MLLSTLSSAALAMGGGAFAPPGPCDGQPNTVLVDGTTRVSSIGAALSYATSLGHHTIEVCEGIWVLPYTLYIYGDVEFTAPLGPEVTVIDASMIGEGPAIVLWAGPIDPSPSLSGFTVTGSPGNGIEIETQFQTTLDEMIISNNAGRGVYVSAETPDIAILFSRIEGNAQGGIALEHYGDLDLRATDVIGNVSPTWGGGVWLSSGGTIRGGVVSGNEAGIAGGGLSSAGSASIDETLFEDNFAPLGGGIDGRDLLLDDVGVYRNAASFGGGLSADSLSMTGSSAIEENIATEDGGGVRAWVGVWGGAVRRNESLLGGGVSLLTAGVLDAVEVSDNIATDGGGVWLDNTVGAEIRGCMIAGNTASRGGGIHSAYVDPGPIVNLVPGAPAQMVTIEETIVERNTASTEGGGIYIEIGDMTTSGGIIRDNIGGGITLALGDQSLFSSYTAYSGNSSADIQMGTGLYGAPSEQFLCAPSHGCTPRTVMPGGDVLGP